MRARLSLLLLATLCLAFVGKVLGAERRAEIRDSLSTKPIYFRIGSDVVEPSFEQNEQAITELGALLTDTTILARLDSVRITATSSPDGNYMRNMELAERRADAVGSYIARCYPRIAQTKFLIHSYVETWQLLRPMISPSTTLFYNQIAAVLELDLTPQEIESRLRTIEGGRAWAEIRHAYLPKMRSGATCVIYTSREPAPTPVPEPLSTPAPIIIVVESEPIVEQVVFVEPLPAQRPLFALKTNLLYDALTALNIEIEIPIGRRWSVAAEYIFPWWLHSSKQYCLQTLSGYLEARYWFGETVERRQLTGWFVGLYGGGGYYDLEWGDKGYQGEFFIPLAISGGYAHSIGRNLSMEYSLGVGYMQTSYREYAPHNCPDGQMRLERKRDGVYHWFGPTRLKVSLVWMINRKTRR